VQITRKIFIFMLIPVILSLDGCGYRLSSSADYASPVKGKKITIPIFSNKSYRANLGAIVTGSLVEEFARRSGGKVVNEDAADLMLTGTVISYSSNPVSYSAFDRVKEYRGTITVEATLTEKNTRKVVWKGTISWSQDYPVNSKIVARRNVVFLNRSVAVLGTDVALLQNSEDAAIREICSKLAQLLYERVSSGF
jgi:outer membrane lipopolysaccharide assembly protein LptE/RlpB